MLCFSVLTCVAIQLKFTLAGTSISSSEFSRFFENLPSSFILDNILPLQLRKCTRVILREDSKLKSAITPFEEFSETYIFDTFVASFEGLSEKNITSFTLNPTNIRDIQRLREVCTLAFIYVRVNSINANSLYNTIHLLNGILRKDRDHFIFLSHMPEKIFNSIFTKGLVATLIKKKIGLRITNIDENRQFDIVTNCFYCGKGATSKVIQLQQDQFTFPDYLTNFNGKTFTVSCAVLTGWLTGIRESSPGKYVAARGMLKFSFDHLSYKFNFSGEFFPSTGGGGTGNRFPNGTWAGATGDVYNGKAELGYPVGVVYKRALIVDYTFPVSYDWLAFTTGVPQPRYSWKSVYWPLNSYVWCLTIASFLLTLFALMCTLKMFKSQKSSLGRIITYLIALFLEQDKGQMEMKESTTRVLVSFWLIFGILVTTAYRSKLVSLISFPVLSEPPNTFQALAETHPGSYHITLQYLRGAAYAILKSSKNPTFQNIFKRMDLEENDAKCFQRSIGTTKHACISWANVANYVYNKNLSDGSGYAPLIMAPDTSTFIAVSYVFRKGEIFKEKFDTVISLAVAMGIKEKWVEMDNEFVRRERVEWERSENITKVEYDLYGSKALRIEHLLGTFYILLGGTIFGALVVLVEIFGEKCLKSYNSVFNFIKKRRNTPVYVNPKRKIVSLKHNHLACIVSLLTNTVS